jgi:hypothetical protein
MSIEVKSFSVIIPRSLIDGAYPGGVETLIEERHIPPELYDDNIVSFNAEDSIEIDSIIEEWTNLGLRDIRKRKGKRSWIDICLVESSVGPTLPCKWLKFENGLAEYSV